MLPLSNANGQTPSCGTDEHVEMAVRSPVSDVKTVTSIDSLVNLGLNENGKKFAAGSFLDRGTGTF